MPGSRSLLPEHDGRHPFLRALNRGLLLYGTVLPYHPGKWRITEAIVQRARLDRLYRRKAFVVRRQGIIWKLRPDELVQRSLYYCNYYEAKETKVLSKLVKPDWVFFDVGAFFGYYSLLVCRLSRGRATAHAFEAFAPNYELLLEHKRLNGFANLHAHRAAVSDRCGEIRFQAPRPEASQGGGWIVERPEQVEVPEAVRTVPAVSLDAFCAEHGIAKVDFIKVDTEGAEWNVLSGAADTIRKSRPAMMIEVNPGSLARHGRRPDELLRLLRDFGYTPHRAAQMGRLERFEDFESLAGDDDYCNVFCFPSSPLSRGRTPSGSR